MKKFYGIYRIEEYRKKYDNTQTHLKQWGYGGDSLGDVVITTEDEATPDRGQLFLVTVEPITKDDCGGESFKPKIIEERRKKDELENPAGIKTGRKFR